MATYWENSCSFGSRYVSWCGCLIDSLFFSHLGFWGGNLFLIAPFPDLYLLVPFNVEPRDIKTHFDDVKFDTLKITLTPSISQTICTIWPFEIRCVTEHF